jgi:hypothetical protein
LLSDLVMPYPLIIEPTGLFVKFLLASWNTANASNSSLML